MNRDYLSEIGGFLNMSGEPKRSHSPGGNALQRSSSGTLYAQLYDSLVSRIRDGSVGVGERMPTESEVIAEYSVSRTTVRRAFDDLRRVGLVESFPGRGTFVLPPVVNAEMPYLHSIIDEIESLGYKAGVQLKSVEEMKASKQDAERLQVDMDDTLLKVIRLRTADEHPFYLVESTLNLPRFPELRNADYATRGMRRIFQDVSGLRIVKTAQWHSAQLADRRLCEALKVNSGDPILHLERLIYLEGDVIVASVEGFLHGGLYKHYSESYPNVEVVL